MNEHDETPRRSWLRSSAPRLVFSAIVAAYGLKLIDPLVVLLGLGFLIRPLFLAVELSRLPLGLRRFVRRCEPLGRAAFVGLCTLVILRELSKVSLKGATA